MIFAAPLLAQDEPTLTIDEDCTTFAFASDGRIAYAVRHLITVRKIRMQRDDIWITSPDGKRKRILNGEKYFPSNAPISFSVQDLAWSPDGARLTVEMFVRRMVDAEGKTEDAAMTLLFDDEGKEIRVEGTKDNAIPDATNAAWLSDGVTVGYLAEAVKPRLLFGLYTLRPVAGRGARLFEDSAFLAVAWDPKKMAALAIERDAQLSGPPRLVWLDLQKQTRRVLAQLPGYFGQLTLSPSGTKVAYFVDPEKLEIRDLQNPDRSVQVRMALGPYRWDKTETRILLKRGAARRASDLMWIRLADGQAEPVLHSLTFWDFDISPDGRHLAVTVPGKRKLQVYELK